MKTRAFRALAVGGLGALLMMGNAPSAQAGSIIIDDWNLTESGSSGKDTTVDNVGVFGARGVGGTHWGARDQIYSNLTAGDGVETIDCANCDQGHGVNDANSEGHGLWSWLNGRTEFFGPVLLDYAAEVDDFDIVASWVLGGKLVAQIHWMDLAATDPFPLPLVTLQGELRKIFADEIYLEWFSVGGAFAQPDGYRGYVAPGANLGLAATAGDLNVDNFIVQTPEPGSLALLGLGLVGLGFARRRKA